jgi:hypothetical protein
VLAGSRFFSRLSKAASASVLKVHQRAIFSLLASIWIFRVAHRGLCAQKKLARLSDSPSQCARARVFVRIRQIDGVASFAPVQLRVKSQHFPGNSCGPVPALEMASADLALRVQFIARTHARPALFDFRAIGQQTNYLGFRARTRDGFRGAASHMAFSAFIVILLSVSIVQPATD